VPLHPIIISILFHHYKKVKECISEVERIEEEARVTDSKNNEELTIKKEEEKQEEIALLRWIVIFTVLPI
jgi:hypothetical protein